MNNHNTEQPEKQVVPEIEDELIIITTRTAHELYKVKGGVDALALYTFYYYTSKWQKTNQPKAADNYCAKGLKWRKSKLLKAKRVLKSMGLIEVVTTKSKGKVTGWYVKLKYKWTHQKEVEILSSRGSQSTETRGSQIHIVETGTTNAYSANNIKCLQRDNLSQKQTLNQKTPDQVVSKRKTIQARDFTTQLTDLQLWEIAGISDVTPPDVKRKYREILANYSDHQEKNFYNKRNMANLLQDFIKYDVQKGNIETMNEMEKMIYPGQHPAKRMALLKIGIAINHSERDQKEYNRLYAEGVREEVVANEAIKDQQTPQSGETSTQE